MKTSLTLTIILNFMVLITFGQQQLSLTDFTKQCDSLGLDFSMPKGYTVKEVIDNPDLYYSFAIINQDASMEVRYTIWSLKPQLL